jgi:hypothetical protein
MTSKPPQSSFKAAEEFAAWFTPEALHPDLEKHVRRDNALGSCIHHPLVIQVFHVPQMNKMVNAQYANKLRAVAEARAAREWDRFVFLHERPYRLDALLQVLPKLTGTRKGWKLIEEVWTDAEGVGINFDAWETIFSSGGARLMMNTKERRAFDVLPESVEVYRGAKHKHRRGFSWTLSREKAEWFAQRFDMRGAVLLSRTIAPARDALALLLGRGEDELLLRPHVARSLRGVRVDPL